VQQAEFDHFAQSYRTDHAANIKISGEDIDFFARYKVVELRRLWTQKRFASPKTILDFGCGVGASLPFLRDAFPDAHLSAFDISEESLSIAQQRFDGEADFISGDETATFKPGKFDLVFTSCVFHHVDATHHVALLTRLRQALSPNGHLVIFEHNPFNPVTRYIVATCPFDENAVLLPADELRKRQRAAGFHAVEIRYVGFMPHLLAKFRWLEPYLAALPMGAQYYTIADV